MNHAQPAQRGATGWSGKRWVPGRCVRRNCRSLWVRPRRVPAAAAYASASLAHSTDRFGLVSDNTSQLQVFNERHKYDL